MSERLQEIYNTVRDHLLKQNKKSLGNYIVGLDDNVSNGCVYRSYDGLKCAAGCLIPDSKYKRSMEGIVVKNVAYFWSNYGSTELNLIEDLQRIHDWSDVSNWSADLAALAKKYELKA